MGIERDIDAKRQVGNKRQIYCRNYVNILVRGGVWQWFFDSGVAWRWKERKEAVVMRLK
jgi:hypothetical protein